MNRVRDMPPMRRVSPYFQAKMNPEMHQNNSTPAYPYSYNGARTAWNG